jgi:hypothetical protein
MFKLLRYFSITSLVAFVVVVALLGMFYRQSALDDMMVLQERQHVTLTRIFSNSIWPTHAASLTSVSGLDAAGLRARPETASLRVAILAQMQNTAVVKVKIYNRDGLTIFSTEPCVIGSDQSDNDGVRATLSGQVASELTHGETINAFDRVIENRDVFSSYIPLRRAGQKGAVDAVFEIYTDVTPFLQQIARTQLRVVVGVALMLAGL